MEGEEIEEREGADDDGGGGGGDWIDGILRQGAFLNKLTKGQKDGLADARSNWESF